MAVADSMAPNNLAQIVKMKSHRRALFVLDLPRTGCVRSISSRYAKMYEQYRLHRSHVHTHTYSYRSSIAPSLYLLCMGMLGVWGVGEGVLVLPSPSAAGPEPLRTTPSRSESLVEAGRAEKRENGEEGINQRKRERSQCEGWRTQDT